MDSAFYDAIHSIGLFAVSRDSSIRLARIPVAAEWVKRGCCEVTCARLELDSDP